jgi:hypothetical protein
MSEPKFPHIQVQLTGENGNAFVLLGKVAQGLRRSGIAEETINEFTEEAKAGNYDHLLRTHRKWVDVA